jgi:hypothetical protein
MMGKAKRSGEITIPADRVRALGVYWLRADVMHSLVLATEDAWLEDAKANKEKFETYIAFLAIGALRCGRRVQGVKAGRNTSACDLRPAAYEDVEALSQWLLSLSAQLQKVCSVSQRGFKGVRLG